MVSRIEQLINEIEEFIDSCKYQPLSNTKILVNKEELEELLVELRLRIPDEIKQYQKIISNQDAILNEARTQADAMLQEANAQTNELVNEHEIMQRAYANALSLIHISGDIFGMRQSGDMEFKLADIFTDAEILKQVSEEVDRLLEEDPGLEREDHRDLKKRLDAYLTKSYERLNL